LAGVEFCNILHKCIPAEPGVAKLVSISIVTKECISCTTSDDEEGVLINIRGETPADPDPVCYTQALDNLEELDYTAGHTAMFDSIENGMGLCYLANLNGNNVEYFNVKYLGQGEWIPDIFRLDYSGGPPRCCYNTNGDVWENGQDRDMVCLKCN